MNKFISATYVIHSVIVLVLLISLAIKVATQGTQLKELQEDNIKLSQSVARTLTLLDNHVYDSRLKDTQQDENLSDTVNLIRDVLYYKDK